MHHEEFLTQMKKDQRFKKLLIDKIVNARWSGLREGNENTVEIQLLSLQSVGVLTDSSGQDLSFLVLFTEINSRSTNLLQNGNVFAIPLCFEGELSEGMTYPPATEWHILEDIINHWKKFFKVSLGMDSGEEIFTSNVGSINERKVFHDFKGSIEKLGGGDTTNVVLHLVPRDNDHDTIVLKLYPRVACNPTLHLSHLLQENGFTSFPPVVLDLAFTPSFLAKLASTQGSWLKDSIKAIEHQASKLNSSISRFFPFIQVFTFIKGDRDGGFPFWRNALESLACGDIPASNMENKDIMTICQHLGSCVANFHEALLDETRLDLGAKMETMKQQWVTLEERAQWINEHMHEIQSTIKADIELGGIFTRAREQLSIFMAQQSRIPDNNDFKDAINNARFQLVHQDLHLMQMQYHPEDARFFMLDLEGDPQAHWKDKLLKFPIEKDLASLVRSFSYIKHASFRQWMGEHKGVDQDADDSDGALDILPFCFTSEYYAPGFQEHVLASIGITFKKWSSIKQRADKWEDAMKTMVIREYMNKRPVSKELMNRFMASRLISEIFYEMQFRPRNTLVPLAGFMQWMSFQAESD
ncbi:hypothetical protein GF325_03470 [Candidatus Bathyarchaeota archaeon]|nr:hypothetical protein [Candidatus Bathyarchaeota archaeon]